MFGKFITWVRSVISMLFPPNTIKTAIGADVAISSEMQNGIDLWWKLFQGNPPWEDKNTQSLGLPASITGELARLVTVEFESSISGDARAKFLQEDYKEVLKKLREKTEYAIATGGLVFKPYVDNGRIVVDYVHAGRFLPTAFNSRGEVTGAVFVERLQKGKLFYTRMEHHQITDSGYVIKNLVYASHAESELGVRTSLAIVDEWKDLTPEMVLKFADGSVPTRPLFAYFKMPFANQIDDGSPLGVSAYSRAVSLIEQADKQYSRILWEYEGGELAIDASMGAIMGSKLPERRKRLFRELGIESGNGKDLYSVFNPQIRDSALFNGLNQLLRRIEFNCYLSYGTLSDPQNQEKTAEEIKMSKQRSYSAVSDIRKALQSALEQLVWAMDFYARLYKLTPDGEYEIGFTWGDGVLTDTAVEYAQRKALVDSGYLKPELFLAWYFGITEDEAKQYIPKSEDVSMFEE